LKISIRSSNSGRTVPIQRSAIAFARGVCAGVRKIRMPSLVKTVSKTLVHLLSRSRPQEREARHAVAEINEEVACLLGDPGAARVRRDAEKVRAAGGVLDEEQDIQPLAQQRIDAEKVGGENALCSGGRELSPGGAIPACRARRNRVTKPSKFTLDAPVTPRGVLRGQPQGQPGAARAPCNDLRCGGGAGSSVA
jgi:hypothetical protein